MGKSLSYDTYYESDTDNRTGIYTDTLEVKPNGKAILISVYHPDDIVNEKDSLVSREVISLADLFYAMRQSYESYGDTSIVTASYDYTFNTDELIDYLIYSIKCLGSE